jgi:hypothetical protein
VKRGAVVEVSTIMSAIPKLLNTWATEARCALAYRAALSCNSMSSAFQAAYFGSTWYQNPDGEDANRTGLAQDRP